ncbi:glutathione-disulfide reductase [Marinicella sp. W31]|uniref:glutathione-disulfide reductase n=1 Tax=Marinicella sp. W31 TaxID=3023713 RepID=UPI0037576707
MPQYDYDLFVIGAGSGGVRAARIAASHGKKVAICESDRVGGTCVIRGCVPKKLFVYASQYRKLFKAAESFGWQVNSQFNWADLMSNKNKEIDRLNTIYLDILAKHNVQLMTGHGKFVDQHTVEVAGECYSAQNILIATGSHPKYPEIEGLEHVISSDDALELATLPESIIINGAGYIGIEFACIFNSLGVKVDLVYHDDLILKGFDRQIREWAQEAYQNAGINIRLDTQIHAVQPHESGSGYVCSSNQGDLTADLVMFATGRAPNTAALNLEATEVPTDAAGHIIVDQEQYTGVAGIYAVGDVCNRYKLTPVAIKEGHLLVDRLFNDSEELPEYDHIPTAVFGQPEIASCGLTEDQAEQFCEQIQCYTSSFRAMKFAMTDIQEKTHMKLIFDEKKDLLMGCHIIGQDAAEMIQTMAVAMKKGVSKSDLKRTMALHPSSAEELVTMT